MKALRLIVALATVGFVTAALQGAGEEKKDKPSKAAGCCVSAEAKGEKCGHGCCVEAAKAGNNCEKCKGSGKIEKKEKKENKPAPPPTL